MEGQTSLVDETVPAEVRCDLLVHAPILEVKCAIRDDLIELVTVVGVCKLIRSCLLVPSIHDCALV